MTEFICGLPKTTDRSNSSPSVAPPGSCTTELRTFDQAKVTCDTLNKTKFNQPAVGWFYEFEFPIDFAQNWRQPGWFPRLRTRCTVVIHSKTRAHIRLKTEKCLSCNKFSLEFSYGVKRNLGDEYLYS